MRMNSLPSMPTDVSIITTYRCQMRCEMCDIWSNPTQSKLEINADDLKILPQLRFVNITGGEPFVRSDIGEIIEMSFRKAKRVVVSTSGWHTRQIKEIAKQFPNIGIRVSIEGLPIQNDKLRGREGGFDRGLRTLLELKRMGIKDIGFGQTVSNKNSHDLIPLYELSKSLGFEFATAALHNSYYFHKKSNKINDKDEVIRNFKKLILELLKENNPKSWFRAFFNLGLINYINENRRMLPCQAGSSNFFIEPYGEVFPCNGLEEKYWKKSMGNIRTVQSFDELWFGDAAQEVRNLVKTCPKNCWMVGTAAPVMKQYIKHPLKWALTSKIKLMLGQEINLDQIPWFDVGQSKLQGDLRIPTKAKGTNSDAEFFIQDESIRKKLIKEIEDTNVS